MQLIVAEPSFAAHHAAVHRAKAPVEQRDTFAQLAVEHDVRQQGVEVAEGVVVQKQGVIGLTRRWTTTARGAVPLARTIALKPWSLASDSTTAEIRPALPPK